MKIKRRWLIAGTVITILILLALTARWWALPLLQLIGGNSEVIQGLEAATQLLLVLGAAIAAFWGWLGERKSPAQDTPVILPPVAPQTTVTNGDHNTIVQGYNNLTGTIVIGGNVGGDVTVNQDTRQGRLQALKQRYYQTFAHQCDALPLTALGGDKRTFDDVHLGDVYVDLNVFPRQSERAAPDMDVLQRMARDEEKLVSALEATANEKNIVLTGDPGSGKSTFVRQLAGRLAAGRVDGAKQALPHWPGNLFPVMLILRTLTPHLDVRALKKMSPRQQQQTVSGLIKAQWQRHFADMAVAELGDMLDDLFAGENILLIFDGLDELPETARPFIKEGISALQAACPTIKRVIVTSRTRSYHGQARLENFTDFRLAPFTEKQIKRFIGLWYQAQQKRLGQNKVTAQTDNLTQAVFQNKGLREMARNPMLLTTMAIIHQQQNKLPDKQVKVYNLAVDVLLQRWQEEKEIRLSDDLTDALSDGRTLRKLMEMIAYQIHCYQSQTDKQQKLTRPRLIELLQQKTYLGKDTLAIEFLDYADKRAGLLVSYGGDETSDVPVTYDFPHRTFQEYLAGSYMVTGREMRALYQKHVQEGDFWQVAALLGAEELCFNDSRGLKTLLDLMYDLVPEKEPEKIAQWRATLWSAQMAVVVGQAQIEADSGESLYDDGKNGPAYLKRLIPRVVQLLEGDTLPPLERVEAGRALAKLGDPRPGITTVIAIPAGSKQSPTGITGEILLPDILWCRVPAGEFKMGSETGDSDEKPQHTVRLPEYYLSRYPITNAQYTLFVQAEGYRQAQYWTAAKAGNYWTPDGFNGQFDTAPRLAPYDFGEPFTLPNHPVVGVSWYEAVAYCRWLAEQFKVQGSRFKVWGEEETLNLKPGTWIIRLPGEAEWEKGARGTDGREYPWGEAIDKNRLNYDQTGIGTTSAVGAFAGGESPYGLQDCAGNVWEWCSTIWGEKYLKGQNEWSNDYVNRTNDHRVLRGGAYNISGDGCRCAYRAHANPGNRDWNNGFRVMLSP